MKRVLLILFGFLMISSTTLHAGEGDLRTLTEIFSDVVAGADN